MRKIYTILLTLGVTASVFAQTPQKMSYQAVIRNSSNQLVVTQAVGMKISILQGSATGTAIYTETQTPNTNANGLVSIEIGGNGDFDAINWASGLFFIKTETDPTGGTNYTITGTSQLLSVPYALYAKTAENGISIAQTLKLAGIAEGAEVNVNSDWNATSGDAQILNKPTTLSGFGITDAVKISENQTVAGNKTFIGTTTVNTPVNATDAVNKEYVDALKEQIEELQIYAGIKIKDIDGNTYRTVTIGTQVWMVENLKTTHYKDGTPINKGTVSTNWTNLTTGTYGWYNNDSLTYANPYGAIYNWFTVETGNLCPVGWHVPTDIEWTELTDYLGGASIAGGKLKEIGTTHWITPNSDATNKTSFKALPGGYIGTMGSFYGIKESGFWWSSTEESASSAYLRIMHYNGSHVTRDYYGKIAGSSIRCIKD